MLFSRIKATITIIAGLQLSSSLPLLHSCPPNMRECPAIHLLEHTSCQGSLRCTPLHNIVLLYIHTFILICHLVIWYYTNVPVLLPFFLLFFFSQRFNIFFIFKVFSVCAWKVIIVSACYWIILNLSLKLNKCAVETVSHK